jgi:hypothetical protein
MIALRSFKGLALGVLPLFLIGSGAALRYMVRNLGINTDTADMLSEALPFPHAHERCRQGFPALIVLPAMLRSSWLAPRPV